MGGILNTLPAGTTMVATVSLLQTAGSILKITLNRVFRNKTEARTFAAKKCHSRTGNLCPDKAQPRTNRGYFFFERK